MSKWFDRLTRRYVPDHNKNSILRQIVSGSFYRVSDLRKDTDIATIRAKIDTMRALALDSQIATALSYYATDATTTNSAGQVIWATPVDPDFTEVADIVNEKFKQWKVSAYARDHILELATVGNLFLPSTDAYRDVGATHRRELIGIDNNTIPNKDWEMIPSTKLDPEDVTHIFSQGEGMGYIVFDEDGTNVRYDESAIIHFTLGGLLGDYTISGKNKNGEEQTFDILFGKPLMEAAMQPTQTLSLLEDALVLSSLSRMVRFISVECGNAEEEEIQATLQQVKDAIEQQLALNTSTGSADSFVNPQSPNNLIYLPMINGQTPISITDMNMSDATQADNTLLNYYQNKKLSVLGLPKEAMNFSSAEGLGGAGAVMSQRSALYANSLQRIESAYMAGWQDAINQYFIQHGMKGFVDKYTLHMNPIITQMSTVNFDRRDSALSQASALVQLMKDLQVKDNDAAKTALTEILTEVFPQTGSDVNSWDLDIKSTEGGDEGAF